MRVAAGLLALVLSHGAVAATAPCPAVSEAQRVYADVEAFDLERLVDVDISRKRVVVDVSISDNYQLASFKQYRVTTFGIVKEFFIRYGIELDFRENASPLSEHDVKLRVVPTAEMPADCKNLQGCAYPQERVMYVSVGMGENFLGKKPSKDVFAYWWQCVAHELGHMFGLYHVGVIKDSDIPISRYGIENLMVQEGSSRDDYWRVRLDPLQVKQMHSYLTCGKVFWAKETVHQLRLPWADDGTVFYGSVARALELRKSLAAARCE